MKTVIIDGGGLDKLSVQDRAPQEPKKNEVKIRWHASSLNYHDYLVAKGAIPVSPGRVPMSDGAGEITGLGEDVTDWKIGDRVMSLFFPGWIDGAPELKKLAGISGETMDGYLTEESCIDAGSITAIPDDYSYAEAACLPCAGLTAWNALVETGRVSQGESVLVEGTGGMSIFALQFAIQAGAKIYATSSSTEKFDTLRQMGVRKIVNYREDENWGKTIYRLSDGGVHHVLDVGGGSTMKQSIEAAGMGGRIYAIGILGDGRKGEITFPKLFFKFIQLSGLAVGSRVMQERMVRAININGIRPVIDKSFAFDQLADAFRYQESGKHFGKIVLEW